MTTVETISIGLGAFVAGLTIVGFFMKNIKTNIANAVKRAELDKGYKKDIERLDEKQEQYEKRLTRFETAHDNLIDRLLDDANPKHLK